MEHITLSVEIYFDRSIEADQLDGFIDQLNQVLESQMTDGQLRLEDASVLDFDVLPDIRE